MVSAGVLLAVVLLCAWVGIRGALAYDHLSQVQAIAPAAVGTLATDPATARSQLREIAVDSRAAHDLTSDGIWAIAERLPWAGPQLAAFGTVAMSTDQLATSALLPLLDTTAGLDLEVLSPSGGKFDTHALSELAVPAQTAAEAAGAAAAAVQEIDRVPLVGAVARAVNSADDVLTRSAAAMDALARASKLVPTMLGRDGPRSYCFWFKITRSGAPSAESPAQPSSSEPTRVEFPWGAQRQLPPSRALSRRRSSSFPTTSKAFTRRAQRGGSTI